MQFFRCRAGAPACPLILCFCTIFEALGFLMLLHFLYSKKVKSIINPNTVKSALHQNLSQYTQYIQTIYKENLFVGYFWLNFMMKINSTSIIFLYEFIHIYMINLSMINIVVIHNIIIEHNEKHKHNKDK